MTCIIEGKTWAGVPILHNIYVKMTDDTATLTINSHIEKLSICTIGIGWFNLGIYKDRLEIFG